MGETKYASDQDCSACINSAHCRLGTERFRCGYARCPTGSLRHRPRRVFTWTGLYFGGHGGCAHDRKNYTPGAFRSDDLGSTFTLDPANGGGCYGGVQVGYNYQVASWVWGIEADASWGEVKSRTNLLQTEPAHIDTLAQFDQKLTSFGTVRGRLGYTWNWGATPTLWYVTGGWAWARTSWRRPHRWQPKCADEFSNPTAGGPSAPGSKSRRSAIGRSRASISTWISAARTTPRPSSRTTVTCLGLMSPMSI